MKKITALSIAMLLSVAPLSANAKWKGNAPCSGKKGGVKMCTAGGKYMCMNGSISTSKRICH